MMLFLLGTIYVVDIAYLQNIHYIIMARNSSSSSKNAISNIKYLTIVYSKDYIEGTLKIKLFFSTPLTTYFKTLNRS